MFDVLYDPCCGLDVHQRTVTACLKSGTNKQTRTFRTLTAELERLARWLKDQGCQRVAMESTGVYWKPVYNVLEGTGIPLAVVNARHMKAVPGRKTDVKDAEWICELARHGLIRPSRIPDRAWRELQELVRYRRSLIDERTREANRVHKVLQGANIKLASVVSNVLGVAGRAMIEAMAAGETDPDLITARARTQLKATADQLRQAVEGTFGNHQRFLVPIQLSRIDAVSEKIAALDAEVAVRFGPHAGIICRLDAIPGVGVVTAQELLAGIGTDMSCFPTPKHLASWAKLSPGANQSAGRHKPATTGHGNPFLRAALTEAARAATRTKAPNYFKDRYYRLKRSRGPNRAAIAVAHAILVTAYHMIKDQAEYRALEPGYMDARRTEMRSRQLVRQLNKMGYTVTIAPAA